MLIQDRHAPPELVMAPDRTDARGRSSIHNPAADILPSISPHNTEFVLVSFEGPDPYCRAGGLGVRVSELARSLAQTGFATHLYFLGDPDAAPTERVDALPLHYHRWCQWLSRHHPAGVYDGERAKLADFTASLPRGIVRERVLPAVEAGRRVVILSEEWHTARAACDLADLLWRTGVREQTVMMWNANNTFGFEQVDFHRLAFTQTVSTVSRYMKHEMWRWGCNPIVLPNGIPDRWLEPCRLTEELAESAQRGLRNRLTIGKVARFDPDKRWLMAVDAVARLKGAGLPVLFLARGGMEEHGHDVLQRAREAGLRVRTVRSSSRDPRAILRAILEAAPAADVLVLDLYLSDPIKRALFRVADFMLQNSGREPFGLVGLEAMAAGGLVFTGATGEEYARHGHNALVLDTEDPREIEATVIDLLSQPNRMEAIRARGVRTAAEYTWTHVVELLMGKLRYLAAGREMGPTTEC